MSNGTEIKYTKNYLCPQQGAAGKSELNQTVHADTEHLHQQIYYNVFHLTILHQLFSSSFLHVAGLKRTFCLI